MLHIACILLDDDDNEDLISCDDGGSGPVVLPNLLLFMAELGSSSPPSLTVCKLL